MSELTDTKYGNLTVIREVPERRKGSVYWECKCDCGKIITTRRTNVKSGHTKSCGCIRINQFIKRATKHKHAGGYRKRTAEYIAWDNMIQRCTNPNNKKYPDYGGRGITIHQDWVEFENFIKDMGLRPSKNHSIDRIDNDGNYEPSNCRWATAKTQRRNQRMSCKNTSGVTGVRWHESSKGFQARIKNGDKEIHLGIFKTLEEATEARKQAELKYWGKSSL